jgi:hypothetical protein
MPSLPKNSGIAAVRSPGSLLSPISRAERRIHPADSTCPRIVSRFGKPRRQVSLKAATIGAGSDRLWAPARLAGRIARQSALVKRTQSMVFMGSPPVAAGIDALP